MKAAMKNSEITAGKQRIISDARQQDVSKPPEFLSNSMFLICSLGVSFQGADKKIIGHPGLA